MFADIILKQSEIIRVQTEIIDGLFQIAAQHLNAEDLQELPEVEKIREAVTLRKEVEP